MTTLQRTNVALSRGQLQKMAKAARLSSPVTIRLKANQMTGQMPILLTRRQITRMTKMRGLGRGMQIAFSKATMIKMRKDGGIAPLLLAALPLIGELVSPLIKKLGKFISGDGIALDRRAPRQITGPIIDENFAQSSMTPFKNGNVDRNFIGMDPSQFRGSGRNVLPGLTPSIKKAIDAQVERSMVKRLGQGIFDRPAPAPSSFSAKNPGIKGFLSLFPERQGKGTRLIDKLRREQQRKLFVKALGGRAPGVRKRGLGLRPPGGRGLRPAGGRAGSRRGESVKIKRGRLVSANGLFPPGTGRSKRFQSRGRGGHKKGGRGRARRQTSKNFQFPAGVGLGEKGFRFV